MNPLEKAWAVLKAPIDRHGYSDLPHDRHSEESGMMTNQEEQDWQNWMREQGHPQWADPKSEEGRRYQQERMGSPEDTAEIRRLIEEFNAQYKPAEKKINCEDNSHEEGWSYCGKPECESCGGGEPAENEDPTVGSQPNFVANEREHMRRRE